MSKPCLLDLFCGAGGAAKGYATAGFEVVGVDVRDQPNYPFKFWRADALDVLGSWGSSIAFHFASGFERDPSEVPARANPEKTDANGGVG